MKVLEKNGVRAAAIHGGRSQGQRDRALASFTDGQVSALIATDVAARGIHVDDVACVVHFDLPADARTTSTARAAPRVPVRPGIVVSLVAPATRRATPGELQRAAGIDGELVHPPAAMRSTCPGPC